MMSSTGHGQGGQGSQKNHPVWVELPQEEKKASPNGKGKITQHDPGIIVNLQ